MPKEVIHRTLPLATGEPPTEVEVGWFREKQVQIATINEGVEVPGQETVRGWYVTLDRHQINALIRVLRRARDQAYGADA